MTMSPRKILVDTFPSIAKNFPVYGGWGDSRENACVIDPFSSALPVNSFNPWKVIDTFVEKSIYMYFVVMREENDRYSDISWKLFHRKTLQIDGKIFELQTYEISAYPDKYLTSLIEEWDNHGDVMSGGVDIETYHQRREACKKMKMMEFWFDVTACQLSQNFIVDFPWVVGSFGRGISRSIDSRDDRSGCSVSYEGLYDPETTATVEFYTIPGQDMVDRPDNEFAAWHFKTLLQEMIDINVMPDGGACELMRSGLHESEDDSQAFFSAEFRVDSARSGKQKCFIFLRNYAGHFLKIRLCMPDDDQLKGLALTFAQEIYKNLLMANTSFCEPIVCH